MKKLIKKISLFLLLLFVLAGCTGLRKIPEADYLFTGHAFSFDSISHLTQKRETIAELDDLIKPRPNGKFLWMRPGLSLHNMVKEPNKDKGFRYWLKYRVGRPPVLLSSLNAQHLSLAITNRMQNRGYFRASTDYEVIKKNKTASLEFQISIHQPYTIRSITFPPANGDLLKQISASKPNSLLSSGSQYNLALFRSELERIDGILKDKGYFYFNQRFLVFDADTTVGNRQIDVSLQLTDDIPPNAKTAFRFKNIYVHDDFSLLDYNPDTLKVGRYFFITNNAMVRPEIVLNSIFIYHDSLYSRRNHMNTVSHMMGIGLYKFANIRFLTSEADNQKLDAVIFLTPFERHTVSAELNAAVKSTNFAGPGIKLSYKNRNAFRGAELFSVNFAGRFETQFGGDFKTQTTYEVTLDASLEFPRTVPFRTRKKSQLFVPKTRIEAGAGIFSRVDLFTLNSFSTAYSYLWKPEHRRFFEFKPVVVSYFYLSEVTEAFEEYLQENPNVRRSFEEQFIFGVDFSFTFSNLHLNNLTSRYFYFGGIDMSGNLISAFKQAFNSPAYGEDSQYHALGLPYSQFVRLRNDFRYFINLGKSHQLTTRLQASVGFPYGNSSVMPYVKQFFVGGTNSVRAFVARTVGPGSYNPADSIAGYFIDQTGDIKLESTLEYRFPILSYLKGALFVDAGNIWLVNEDEQRPEGKFEFNDFYKEIAVGAGIGFRLDFGVFVIRTDIAMPLRKPYLPEGERWVIDEIRPGDKTWRKENIIWNIAIGYPF